MVDITFLKDTNTQRTVRFKKDVNMGRLFFSSNFEIELVMARLSLRDSSQIFVSFLLKKKNN